MPQPLRILRASLAAAALLAASASAHAQSYGLGDQVLQVPAWGFRPASSGLTYDSAYGYFQVSGTADFVAPLDLPEGAEVVQMCVYGNVPSAGTGVFLALDAGKLVPGGAQPGGMQLQGVSDDIPIGYGVVCTDPFSVTIRQVTDIDNDGALDNVAYLLQAHITDAGFGGVRIFWRRQVSPPPGTATFADVPTTDPFFPYVEALAASGITTGCGNGKFCPDAPLTRRQMAAFLAKALGLHWPTY
jgi:hypothetical protein